MSYTPHLSNFSAESGEHVTEDFDGGAQIIVIVFLTLLNPIFGY